MDRQKATPYKQQLLQAREALLQQLEQLRGGASQVEAAIAHFEHSEDDPSQVYSERELEWTLDGRETLELESIRAALQRIEAGDYGICADCGCKIPAKRLHAAPEAVRCIDCQQTFERNHKPASAP